MTTQCRTQPIIVATPRRRHRRRHVKPQSTFRWRLAAAAVLFQAALGGLYSWSALAHVLEQPDGFALSPSQTALPFAIAHAMTFVGATVGGRIQDRHGPRPVALSGGILYGAGLLFAGTCQGPGDYWKVTVGYGLIAGCGLGCGYIVPVAMLQKWFPDRRGLVTGIAVAGFGLGATVGVPAIAAIASAHPQTPTITLTYLGLAYLVITTATAATFGNPPRLTKFAGDDPTRDFTAAAALRTPQWYLMTGMLLFNVIAGIGFISATTTLASDIGGLSPQAATWVTAAMGIFNGGGRIFWGWLSERLGRMTAFTAVLTTTGLALIAMPQATNLVLFGLLGAVVNCCYGGGFSIMPAAVAEFFGQRHTGAIYGLMIGAWSLGGVVGPLAAAGLLEHADAGTALSLLGVTALLASLLPRLTKPVKPQALVAR